MEKTYCAFKPRFANNTKILTKFTELVADLGFEIEDCGYVKYERADAQKHYAEHFRGSYENAKGFYKELEDYITSDVVYGMVISGEEVIKRMRAILPYLRAATHTMFGEEVSMTENVIHGSDCVESAEKEIALFKELKQRTLKNNR